MRFRVRVDVWIDVPSLSEAQAAMTGVETAALQALGDAAILDPDTGAEANGQLLPVDEAAHEGLSAEDLGPGISTARWRAYPE